jgi:PAS domain S-box-containing protein
MSETPETLDIADLLSRTGAALAGELDLERLVQGITDVTVDLTRAEFGAFFYNVLGDAGEHYMLYALSGVPRENFSKFPMPRNTEIFGPTFRGEGTVRYDDVQNAPGYGKSAPYFGMPPGHLPVRSYLAVPVISRSGEVHGGLFFGHSEVGIFTERHEIIVSGIAAIAATAMDNARLFRAHESARLELAHLNETLEQRIGARVAELRVQEQRFDRLISGIADYAIFLLDAKGHVQTWNTGAERIKGYQSDEIVGRHLSAFYTAEDRAAGVPELALRTAREVGRFEAEAWRVRKDGSRFFANVVLDAIHDSEGQLLGFAKVTRDMTERRALEEQLRQAQKMEAIGQLTGGVAHDFNNLLTIIIGNLDVLARESDNQARRARATENAMHGAQRAATLTQQLLAFSRRQPLNPKRTDVNRLVSQFSDLLRRLLGETIAVETVLGGGLWHADVDGHQLENALLNLAVNARDAMPGGGKLTIETANAHLDELYRTNYAEIAPGQYVMICVSDTGAGMPADVLEHAFEPFYTTKPVGHGTGLGLSQVYGFVKQSGGHIKLYSEPGQGTTAKIYLPRIGEGGVAATAKEWSQATPAGNETVLFVEDDPGVRSYTADALRDLGFEVIEASDAPTALDIVGSGRELDLLFTDVGLPGMNGRQLADRVREARPSLPVLFATGYARNAIVHQGRLDEGVDLLTKPYTRSQLANKIRDMLDRPRRTVPRTRAVLLVEDEAMLREVVAYMLKALGFRVAEAKSCEEAHAILAESTDFEFAIIDVALGDGSGIDVLSALREAVPAIPALIASGAPLDVDVSLHAGAPTAVLAKPYSLQGLALALKSIGVVALLPSSD